MNKSRTKSRKYLGISPCVSSSNLSKTDTLNTQSISKLYVPIKPKQKKVNLELPRGPISGMVHMTIERRNTDGGVMVFRNGKILNLDDNFYRPIVIQTKEKAIDKKSFPININERKKEIKRIFGNLFIFIILEMQLREKEKELEEQGKLRPQNSKKKRDEKYDLSIKNIPNNLGDNGNLDRDDQETAYFDSKNRIDILKADNEMPEYINNKYNDNWIRSTLKNPERYLRKFRVMMDDSYSPKAKPKAMVTLYQFKRK